MKDAKASDWRKRLEKAHGWNVKIDRIELKSLPTVGSLEFAPNHPVVLFTGPNGTGKSTFLRAMWAALDPIHAEDERKRDAKLHAGGISIDLTANGMTGKIVVTLNATSSAWASDCDVKATYIDPANEVRRVRSALSDFLTVEEILNGVGGKELNPNELAEINFILQRDYRQITLYEIEIGEVSPFFEVSHGEDRYDTRTMGEGEFAAFYQWWRLRSLEEGSILLLEEPEAFLSHGCQQALAKYLLRILSEKRPAALVTTHSGPFASIFPPVCVQFVNRVDGSMSFLEPGYEASLMESIGINPPKRATLAVEDKAAKILTHSILQRIDPILHRSVSIEVFDGEGEITSLLRATTKLKHEPKIVGVYDGDMRDGIPADVLERSVCLPGTESIEATCKQLASQNSAHLNSSFDGQAFGPLLATLEGKEIHDWFAGFCDGVGKTREQALNAFVSSWLRSEQNINAAREFVTALKTKIGLNG